MKYLFFRDFFHNFVAVKMRCPILFLTLSGQMKSQVLSDHFFSTFKINPPIF